MSKAIDVNTLFFQLFGLIPEWSYVAEDETENVVDKPTFHFGGVKELNALIVEMKGQIYPLIYKINTTSTGNLNANTANMDLELVLATRNIMTSELNDQRWAMSYKNILFPLLNKVILCLQQGNITLWNGEYTLEEAPNYSETDSKDKNAFTDIIDALIFRTSITLTPSNRCLNKSINFNK